MKKKYIIITILCLFILSCSTERDDLQLLKAWMNLYYKQKREFVGKDYPSLNTFKKPFIRFERKVDSLETNYFNGNKDLLIRDVYNSLPKDFFKWNYTEIEDFFLDVESKEDLALRCMALKTIVLQRFSVLHKTATFETTLIKPLFIKGGNDNYFGEFVIDGKNYSQPPIIILEGDTVPYSEKKHSHILKTKPDFGDKDTLVADMYLISWGDTLYFKVNVVK